jgi:HSP20 family protein
MTEPESKEKSPSRDLQSAMEPFQRMRDDMMSFWSNAPSEGFPWPWAPSGMMRWADPPVDMSETEDGYTISAELPGLKKEDVHVEVEDHLLTISGSKEDVHKGKRKHHQYAERRFGSFKRALTLPRDADLEGIDASFDNGVLTITIPKRPGSDNARKVDVK